MQLLVKKERQEGKSKREPQDGRELGQPEGGQVPTPIRGHIVRMQEVGIGEAFPIAGSFCNFLRLSGVPEVGGSTPEEGKA
jgi:hypothetical protein